MYLTVVGILISSNDEHSQNEFPWISSTDSGTKNIFNDEHFEKQNGFIFFISFDNISISSNDIHLENAFLPILVTVDGICIFVSERQLQNALFLMILIDDRILIS